MLSDQIKLDMTGAMKAGDGVRTSTLRMVLSELNYKKIELQRDLTEEDVIGVVQKEAKKRREAIESYTAGSRPEQAAAEKAELEILEGYLPKMMGEQEVKDEMAKRLADLGEVEFGQAMKVLAPVFRGRADGAVVAKVVKELIG